MNKIKKIIISILTICMLACFSAFAVACGGDDDGDKCNHENVIVCETCGAVVQGNEYYVNYVKSGLSTLGAGKGYNIDLDLAIDIGEIEVDYYDGEESQSVVTATKAVLETKNLFFGFDNDGALYFKGGISASIKCYTENNTEFVVALLDASELKLQGTELSYTIEASVTYPTLSAELQEFNNLEMNESDVLDLEELLETEGEGFQPVMIFTDILPMVVDCYEDVLLPYANTILDANKADVNKAVANAIDTLFAVKKVDGNNVYTMDALGANIKQIPVMLDTDISVLFDGIFGAGQYDKLPQTISALLDYKVSDVIAFLAQKGITVDGLIGVADQLIQKVMGDENITFEAFLSQMTGTEINIKNYIDLVKDSTIRQLIKTLANVEDEEINMAINEQLPAILAEYKNKSIYEIAEVDDNTKAMITESVNAIANMLDEALDVELVLDGSGNIVSTNVGIVFDGSKTATAGFITWLQGVAGIEEFPEFTINLDVKMSVANIPA